MIVSVNMSREVYEYFKDHDLSQVADTLMEMYDFTNLPQISGKREVEKRIDVTNEMYLSLYKALGPRSKKLSLGRLFEFAYNNDVLSLSRFETMRVTTKHNPADSLLDRAYRSLLEAKKYDDSPQLKEITSLVYTYKEYRKEQE